LAAEDPAAMTLVVVLPEDPTAAFPLCHLEELGLR
jgi:hypothetical protein